MLEIEDLVGCVDNSLVDFVHIEGDDVGEELSNVELLLLVRKRKQLDIYVFLRQRLRVKQTATHRVNVVTMRIVVASEEEHSHDEALRIASYCSLSEARGRRERKLAYSF